MKKQKEYKFKDQYLESLSEKDIYDPYVNLAYRIIFQAIKDVGTIDAAPESFWSSEWYELLCINFSSLQGIGPEILTQVKKNKRKGFNLGYNPDIYNILKKEE